MKSYPNILSILLIIGYLVPSCIIGNEFRRQVTNENCLPEGLCHSIFQEDNQIYVNFLNKNSNISYTIEMEISDSANLEIPKGHKEIISIRSGESKQSSRFPIQSRSARWSINYPFKYFYGDIESERDEEYVYRLPYKGRFLVTQGYMGRFTHMTKHALDFAMPEKTPIVASRDGVVVVTVDHFTVGKNDPSYLDKGNNITILHEDGSVAQYHHLYPKGVYVKKGERVKKGQVIGISGNTGYSSLPHLHFQVSKIYRDGNSLVEKTFPTYFQTESGSKMYLEEDYYYWHEDNPLQVVPFLDREGIEICRSFTKEGRVQNCQSRIKRGQNIVVSVSVLKRGLRKYEFQVTERNQEDVILTWTIDAQSDWTSFYTYTSSSKLSPGNYSLRILSDGIAVEPVDFVVEK